MHKNVKDLTGMVFEDWTVIEYAGTRRGKSLWKCVCSCGRESHIIGTRLSNGETKSCLHKSWNKKEIEWEVDISGCWNCTSHARSKAGYSRFRSNGKMTLVHRYMYEQKYGKIPDGMFACHRCDNPACINPDHIFIGTNQDNIDDMCNKNRQNKTKGSNHYKSKLTDEQVREIRFKSSGLSQNYLSRKYGVVQSVIWAIINGHIWKHIKEAP